MRSALHADLPSPSGKEDLVSRRGLVSKLVLCCTNSVCSKEAVICDPYSSESKLLNTRSIMEMRQIGWSRTGLESFCGYMDMLPPVTAASYKIHNERIAVASMEAAEANMQAASQNLHRKFGVHPSALKDVTVTCDGTWSKRGFTATYGVVVVIAWSTGKILPRLGDPQASDVHSVQTNSGRWMLTQMSSWNGGRLTS